ncbi:hydroxyacylglutathione hydrolase [Paracoccus sp. S1E-3]|uniref:hydroxyacylglutathione hydrolase n=1 Tax=Paracoccus sp. S1E-3 TaxID=2756130 RepID=UPI0015EFA0C1|nr:hydroxyacylglutathione hydrolase [Paracoccus sp. S1E-3]MBA4489711.1 hydroxyacylglutathione hydrolase [Paracoccus sp. S1E-3]
MSEAEIVAIRCLRDNYAYLLHANGRTVLFDAPEAEPILQALAERGWRLDQILLTHHHDDHVGAVPELVAATGATVTGAAADAHRLPPLDRALRPGDVTDAAGLPAQVIDVPGHTIGHIAFYVPDARAAFTGDSLTAIGCGRIFEGDAPMMWASLQRLNALPAETLICSGHDYCAGNGAFALTVDPDNADLRDRLQATATAARPCAPVTLAEERATNPFLRAPALAATLGLDDAEQAFAALRAMKDNF